MSIKGCLFGDVVNSGGGCQKRREREGRDLAAAQRAAGAREPQQRHPWVFDRSPRFPCPDFLRWALKQAPLSPPPGAQSRRTSGCAAANRRLKESSIPALWRPIFREISG